MAIDWDDPAFWDDLIFNIEDGLVVPVVGQHAVLANAPGGDEAVYPRLARALGAEVPADAPTPGNGLELLTRVVMEQPTLAEKPQRLYRKIKALFEREAWEPAEPLRQLACISGFSLFVGTTFDDLLGRALEAVQPGTDIDRLSYSLSDPTDLPEDEDAGGRPRKTIYQIFGNALRNLEYAVTEGDVLEYLHHLQSGERSPQRLLDRLRNKDLLLIGNGFPDWVTRFFLRMTRSGHLGLPGRNEEWIVDHPGGDTSSFVFFISKFSRNTEIVEGPTPAAFLSRLYEKWIAVHPEDSLESRAEAAQAAAPATRSAAETDAEAAPDMAPGSIFLSYASEDIEAAEALRTRLDAGGLDVWMDKKRLTAGDDYGRKIQRNIRQAVLFLPVISHATTQFDGARYFRKEWAWALSYALEFTGSDVPFIIPVVVDDLDIYQAENIPNEFTALHCLFAKNGALGEADLAQVVQNVRRMRKRGMTHAL